MKAPLLGWYGDDFTGATDTLAVVTQAGLRAMLFLGVPTAQRQRDAAKALSGELDALGIAGASRSMSPEDMRSELDPVGRFFADLRSPVLHYKVCSTFDSAPHVGSIGEAVRTLGAHVRGEFVPIVGGQPSLGRFCVFSHLFAATTRGGPVERIDRHPTMRNHPVTPMAEADLRRHLAAQGLEAIAAMHYPAYALSKNAQRDQLQGLLSRTPDAVLMDVSCEADLAHVGRLIWDAASRGSLLAVGSSGVAQALAAHWAQSGLVLPATGGNAPLAPATAPVFAFAGSLSPVTAAQVEAARSYMRVPVPASALLDAQEAQAQAHRIRAALLAGQHVLAYTAPSDGTADTRHATALAHASARLVREVVHGIADAGQRLPRVGIAGGDTSSHCALGLGLWGLSCRATLGSGVTVSAAHSELAFLDGLELMLKGGQMGSVDVFEKLLGN